MIRIRTTKGDTIPVPDDGHFVELVNDLDGTVQMVVFQAGRGRILQLTPGSADAQRYQDMFSKVGVTFTPRMIQR